jgi:hypothetical protein
VSRLSRLSARAYGRLTPDQRRAVDVLRYGHAGLDAARRGEAKTVLGWRRTAEETVAYARVLLARGMVPSAIQAELGCTDRHLRRLLAEVPDMEFRSRNPSIHQEKSDITDNGKAAGRPRPNDNGRPPPPHPDPGRIMYAGDEGYDFGAALRRSLR